jgi:hypothetical protein
MWTLAESTNKQTNKHEDASGYKKPVLAGFRTSSIAYILQIYNFAEGGDSSLSSDREGPVMTLVQELKLALYSMFCKTYTKLQDPTVLIRSIKGWYVNL